MRIKLSVKLFSAFFVILAIAVGAMGVSRYLFERNFVNYVHQMELAKLQRLVPVLQAEYRVHRSWKGIRQDARRWDRLMHAPLRPVRPGPPLPGEQKPPGAPPNPMSQEPLSGPPRILLLDAHRDPVFGGPAPADIKDLVPIPVEGDVVGWLGLKRHESFKSGPPADLVDRQTREFYFLGAVVIAMTALIAFLFSRHLLKPIQHLIQGTQKLARRDFSVRISPTTGDELSQLAAHFNSMASTLEEYEKMRRQWLTDISHELRTPLAVLRGEIEAIQDGLREPTPDNMASLHTEILRISKLVEDLHLMSKTDSDKLQLKKDPISLAVLLETVVQGYQSRFKRCRLSLDLQLEAIAGVSITGDADQLERVLTNLMDNALKYVRAPGQVQIAGQVDDTEAVVYFQDSGPGVPTESLPRLFNRLYRVDPSRNRETGGSGLGLSICRQIVDHHGGRIWAEHSPLGGLSIGIRLPLEGKPPMARRMDDQ